MKVLIAIPCLDMMHSKFVMSLTSLKIRADGDEPRFGYAVSSLVYDSRNQLSKQAIDGGYDLMLWLDSDMEFDPDLFLRLKADLSDEVDMVSGFYVTRKDNIKPVVFKDCGFNKNDNGKGVVPFAHTYYDYPKNELFECAAVGFGGVLMKVSLVKEVYDSYGLPFSPVLGFGEDISFCLRARELGHKIYCDSRVKMKHIGNYCYDEKDIVFPNLFP